MIFQYQKITGRVGGYWYAHAHGFMDGLASQWAGDENLAKRDF